MTFDIGNGSSPRSANLSLSNHCYISSTTVATSSIEPSVTSITSMTSMTSTDVISTPSYIRSICTISSTIVATSSIEPSVTSISSMSSMISMTSTDVMTTPSPSPINCSTDGIWPETLLGYNITGFYCYRGTVNCK